MLKTYHIESAVKRAVNGASHKIISRIKQKYGKLDGKEEDITSKLEPILGDELAEGIEKKLNGKRINGIQFDVRTFKKKEESINGADFMGIVNIHLNGQKVNKAFLAQCKVGKLRKRNNLGQAEFTVSSSNDMLKQAEDMLRITSDSFFFIYTDEGVYVIPAFQIRLCNKANSLRSSEAHFLNLGIFYADFLKCFIGDEKMGNNFAIALSNKKDIRPDMTLSYVSIKDDVEVIVPRKKSASV